MSVLDNTLSTKQAEIDAYSPGITQGGQPVVRESSQEWFELRGHALAQAYFKRVQVLGIESDPAACERLYRACLTVFKQAESPPAPEIVRERLPDGSLPPGAVA